MFLQDVGILGSVLHGPSQSPTGQYFTGRDGAIVGGVTVGGVLDGGVLDGGVLDGDGVIEESGIGGIYDGVIGGVTTFFLKTKK